jgi:hypothetical protein
MKPAEVGPLYTLKLTPAAILSLRERAEGVCISMALQLEEYHELQNPTREWPPDL